MQIILLHFNLCVRVYVYVCALMQAMVSQAENIIKESVLSSHRVGPYLALLFHRMGPRDQTLLVRLSSWHLSLLSHLNQPKNIFNRVNKYSSRTHYFPNTEITQTRETIYSKQIFHLNNKKVAWRNISSHEAFIFQSSPWALTSMIMESIKKSTL